MRPPGCPLTPKVRVQEAFPGTGFCLGVSPEKDPREEVQLEWPRFGRHPGGSREPRAVKRGAWEVLGPQARRLPKPLPHSECSFEGVHSTEPSFKRLYLSGTANGSRLPAGAITKRGPRSCRELCAALRSAGAAPPGRVGRRAPES